MGRDLHSTQFLDVVSSQVVVIVDTGVNVVAIQIVGKVYQILQSARMLAHFHRRLKLLVFALRHFIQARSKIIELVKADVLAQFIVETIHIAVIVGYKPFLIDAAELVLLSDTDTLKDLFHFFGGGGKLDPFAHKLALVVFSQVGYKGGKGIIFVIFITRHICTSFTCFSFSEIPA